MRKRLHIGVVCTTFDDTCQHDFWNGIVGYAQQNDIHLTAYMGVYQRHGENISTHYDTCFEMIKQSKSLDGLIMLTGFMAHHLGNEELSRFVSKLPKHLPLISISYEMPGIVSILIDNAKGIFDATEHLIKAHEKKHIAFVRGPADHKEADERLQGYKKALEVNGIEYDESYVLPGDFSRESGQRAVKMLLERHPGEFDAIVASDDETSVGVLDALKKNNLIVPLKIAVTGFDDEWYAQTFIPSITTVKQDFKEIGFIGIKTLLRMLDGKTVDDVTYVSPALILRQSCGCISHKQASTEGSTVQFAAGSVLIMADNLADYITQALRVIFKDKIAEKYTGEWAIRLADAMTEKPFSGEKFLEIVNELLLYYNHYTNDFYLWNDALNVLTMGIELHGDEIEDTLAVRLTLIHATTLVESFKYMYAKTSDFIADDERKRLRDIVGNLVLHFDVTSLSEFIQRSLPELKIDTALIGLYKEPIKSNNYKVKRYIQTIFGYDYGELFNYTNDGSNPMTFSGYLNDKSFDYEQTQRNLIFFPLFFKDEELGAMLISYNEEISVDIYETLRVNISSAVEGTALLSKVRTLSVTDEHTGLLNRRGFFQLAHSRLKHLSRSDGLIPVVLFMDMDGLKIINDTYGHDEGDTAILAFAGVIKDVLREEDIVGRIGGDEFVVLSAVKSEDSGGHIVNRIRDKLDEYNEQKTHPYKLMSSIGCVALKSPAIECFEEAMKEADSILYEEKMRKKQEGLTRA